MRRTSFCGGITITPLCISVKVNENDLIVMVIGENLSNDDTVDIWLMCRRDEITQNCHNASVARLIKLYTCTAPCG